MDLSASSTPPTSPEAAPARAVPPETPGIGGLLTLGTTVIVIACLYFARQVLMPVTLAVLLCFVLAPLVGLLRALRLGRVPSAILAALLGLGVVLALAGLIGTQIAQLADKVPLYETTIARKVEAIRATTLDRITTMLGNIDRSERARAVAQPPPERGGQPAPVPVQVQPPPLSAMSLAESLIAPIVSPLTTTFIVFVVTIFVLLQREDLRDRLIRLFGSGDLHRTTGAMDDAARRLSRYFLLQLCVNAAVGCTIGIGLAVIGVPSPVLWGVLAMLLRFVPYIGTPLAAVLPLALAAAVAPGWSAAIWTAALYIVVESVTGQAIEPVLYGRSTGLSPAAVMISAIFWTWLWGPIGLILSTPLTLLLVVLGRHFTRLEFLDVLLGDRPALSPVESFYQRILAGDPDEAQDQAELLLRDRPLSAYYDEVVVKALRLAAADAARGVLTPEQIARIKVAIVEVVRDLDDHTDVTAEAGGREPVAPSRSDRPAARRAGIPGCMADLSPQWRGEAPVLCVAGRGPLDEAAAAILAQLLGKHGLGARILSHEAVSRGRIGGTDLRGAAMVCLCYLEISGSPAHLRFLLRRLRQHLPHQPILVGLWAACDPILQDAHLCQAIGASGCVESLHAAVERCIEEASRTPARVREEIPDGLPAGA